MGGPVTVIRLGHCIVTRNRNMQTWWYMIGVCGLLASLVCNSLCTLLCTFLIRLSCTFLVFYIVPSNYFVFLRNVQCTLPSVTVSSDDSSNHLKCACLHIVVVGL